MTLLAGAIGFGGMFAVYSYIAPIVTDVGGLSRVGGPGLPARARASAWSPAPGWPALLADWSILRSLLAVLDRDRRRAAGLFAGLAPYGWWAIVPAFLITTIGSVLVVNLQLRLMDVAGDAQTLGAAMNHASLNIANALGAWLGGVVIAAGYGYRSTAVVGAVLSVAGFLVVVASVFAQRRTVRALA